ncbi:polysaccharide pyruvyl transferase family protein [Falsirhodobacter algicola]|uniref:Polysaccharide pyruvyl transferase family protein n=1 Tax=Falsirhodobacter algicola TaxID=2692330 RepID=A0A8J8MQW5_9RHOB|nr:polysaccharide pyruvyl transferase family protein [Falsirhodobacter algicola]QUS35045.1 polysaccharide pyruvyl transferase family protein [Falsirhodobacter algicola]
MQNAKARPTEPLRLFWWNVTPNFGDTLGRDIIGHVARRPVVWSKERNADLISVGSIMWNARKGTMKRDARRAPLVVWGTGCMKFLESDWVAGAHVAAVRGPGTAGILGLPPVAFGDPGLLARHWIGEVERGEQVGIVPHHSQADDPCWHEMFAGDPRVTIIDPREDDSASVIRQIAACRHIFSQSLHGLIIADSYGIPNNLIVPAGIHASAWFKFYDYAAGIHRQLRDVVSLDGLQDAVDGARRNAPLPYAAAIEDACAALLAAFPAHLVARPS